MNSSVARFSDAESDAFDASSCRNFEAATACDEDAGHATIAPMKRRLTEAMNHLRMQCTMLLGGS